MYMCTYIYMCVLDHLKRSHRGHEFHSKYFSAYLPSKKAFFYIAILSLLYLT